MAQLRSKVWIQKNSSKRLFLAVTIPSLWESRLSSYQTILKETYGRTMPVLWTPTSNFHITLRFIGNMEVSKIAKLIHSIRDTCLSLSSFSLPFESVHIATEDDPKMIWVRFTNTPEFSACVSLLTEHVSHFLQKECRGMVLKNGHDIIPHVTLARFKGTVPPVQLPLLSQAVPFLPVRTIVLNESKTLPTGSRYTTLATFRLKEDSRLYRR